MPVDLTIDPPTDLMLPEFASPVPEQWISYGDMAFQERSVGESPGLVEVADLDRIIAWGFAFASEPDATAPVADEIVRANGYPLYPVLGYYDTANLGPAGGVAEAEQDEAVLGGMSMTFKYGPSDPFGGSGWLQGRFYLRKRG
jgi:hypothetical protein